MPPRSLVNAAGAGHFVVLQIVTVDDGVKALSYDHAERLSTQLLDLVRRVRVDDPSSNLSSQDMVTAFLPRCVVRDETDAVVLAGGTVEEVSLIEVRSAKNLSFGWSSTGEITDPDSIVSLIERYMKKRESILVNEIFTHLVEASELADIDGMRAELDDIYRSEYPTESSPEPPETMPDVVRRIMEMRLRISEIRNLVASSSVRRTRYEDTLAANVAELDSLGLVAMSGLVYKLQLQVNSARTAQQRDTDRRERRDRRLARLVAAFILPTLWLSYLGVNVLPTNIGATSLQSEVNALIALLVSIALAVSGWLLAKVIAG